MISRTKLVLPVVEYTSSLFPICLYWIPVYNPKIGPNPIYPNVEARMVGLGPNIPRSSDKPLQPPRLLPGPLYIATAFI